MKVTAAEPGKVPAEVRKRLPWASRPAALTLAPPDETNLEDLSAVADGRGPEARPGAVS